MSSRKSRRRRKRMRIEMAQIRAKRDEFLNLDNNGQQSHDPTNMYGWRPVDSSETIQQRTINGIAITKGPASVSIYINGQLATFPIPGCDLIIKENQNAPVEKKPRHIVL